MADEIVGKRVLCEGFRGEIKFVGPVPPTQGEWYGIEWDDHTRGKHDGTNEGVSYFECKHPKGGSFVRPKKVDFGIGIIEALKQRYGQGSDSINQEDMYVMSGKHKKKAIEMVGADSIQEKQRENQLKLPSAPETLLPSFSTVKVIFLNRMQFEWYEVEVIVSMMPSLKELHTCHNCLRNLSKKDGQVSGLQRLQNISLLNLQGNQFSDWGVILKLGHLPKLNQLILNDNGITKVELGNKVTEEYGSQCLFPALRSLYLSENKISEIQSVNELNHFPSLMELKFKGNPVFQEETTFASRQELLARLPSLTSLNGSPVNSKERETAERAYLKKYAQAWLDAGGKVTEEQASVLKPMFVELHPRYAELVKVHGVPPEAERTQKTSKTLKDSLISVTITCPDVPDKKSVLRKLPGTMTIGKLKGLLYRLFKVDITDQQLYCVDSKLGREVELDDDLRQLSFYSVRNGDTIYLRW
ncbi:tubulin-specific chaperone E-like isoform X2 [Acropora millepora]|uniref:tubulin-specific chaperone E-like isoform X2 n=1 Tax=Acropora millepora TaxID=45264 RepID=UPI001CF11C35|nr:tubulin-specific chaperone E-like isoform X2 [Acropora millepora]